MNRDEFDYGFEPEEEKAGRGQQAGNTGHTFVPAFRQAANEGNRQRRNTAFHRDQGDEPGFDGDFDGDYEDADMSRAVERQPGSSRRVQAGSGRALKDEGLQGRATARQGADAGAGRSRRNTGSGRGSAGNTGRTGAGGGRGGRQGGNGGSKKVFAGLTLRGLVLLIAAQLTAFAIIGCVWWGKRMLSLMQTDTEFNKEDITNPYISVDKEQQMSGYWTVALFGVDSRNNSVGKGSMSDVIIICNINQENGEIKLVSVFRDTYLNIDEKNTYNKINMAYAKGGPKQAVEALNRNLDLEIDDYATFNWKAVADAINILGGVDVELSKAEFYYINAYITETVKSTGIGSHQLKSAGPNHLDGVQAVAYARLRKMDTDFARTERQRKIIELCFEKLKKADFAVVNNVMEVVFPQILSSITLNDVIPAAKNLSKYHIAATAGFPEARSDAILGKKGDCVIPQTLESNVITLHKFLFDDENYVPSEMVKKISSKISSDTGMYKEGKPVESVGTDGGYVPKATTAAKEKETKESESQSSEKSSESTHSTDESIIDGEYPDGLETDANGNVIDPSENYGPGIVPSESDGTTQGSQSGPGASTESSGSLKPTVPSGTLSPGTTETSAEASKGNNSSSNGPGGVSGSDDVSNGPGAASQPSQTQPSSSGGTVPGAGNVIQGESQGNDVIIGPGA